MHGRENQTKLARRRRPAHGVLAVRERADAAAAAAVLRAALLEQDALEEHRHHVVGRAGRRARHPHLVPTDLQTGGISRGFVAAEQRPVGNGHVARSSTRTALSRKAAVCALTAGRASVGRCAPGRIIAHHAVRRHCNYAIQHFPGSEVLKIDHGLIHMNTASRTSGSRYRAAPVAMDVTTPTTLPELSGDAHDAIAQHLSPRDVGRLMRTCRDLSVVASPGHPSWAALRSDVKKGAWQEACRSAAERGDIQAVRWAGAQGQDFACACRSAASGGDVPMVQWLHARTPISAWNKRVVMATAAAGRLEVLRWLCEQTCDLKPGGWVHPWGHWTCESAASGGRIEVLQWLREQSPPCPWSARTCVRAAQCGQLETLKWLRSQTPPCPWSDEACACAAAYGRVDVLRWMRAQRPPCPMDMVGCLKWAQQMGQPHVVVWIREQLTASVRDELDDLGLDDYL